MLSKLLIRLLPFTLALIVSLFGPFNTLSAQELEIDSLGFETFTMEEGDTTYIMKKYFIVYLKKGPNQEQSPQKAQEIQAGHMANMKRLSEEGSLCIAGPMGDDGDVRGIMILSVPTIDEVQEMVAQDPAVIAGRLIMDIQPFWAAQGSKLF